jgi:hypothetical protein
VKAPATSGWKRTSGREDRKQRIRGVDEIQSSGMVRHSLLKTGARVPIPQNPSMRLVAAGSSAIRDVDAVGSIRSAAAASSATWRGTVVHAEDDLVVEPVEGSGSDFDVDGVTAYGRHVRCRGPWPGSEISVLAGAIHTCHSQARLRRQSPSRSGAALL